MTRHTGPSKNMWGSVACLLNRTSIHRNFPPKIRPKTDLDVDRDKKSLMPPLAKSTQKASSLFIFPSLLSSIPPQKIPEAGQLVARRGAWRSKGSYTHSQKKYERGPAGRKRMSGQAPQKASSGTCSKCRLDRWERDISNTHAMENRVGSAAAGCWLVVVVVVAMLVVAVIEERTYPNTHT